MSITLNTINGSCAHTGAKYWIVAAQTADSTGNETLRAAEAGKCHYIEKFRVDMCPGTTAASFTINSDAAALLGPIDLVDYGSAAFWYEFLRPVKVPVGTAIKMDTEAADQIHIVMEGYTV